MNKWSVYIIDKAGRYYTGITTDLKNRLRQHGVSEALYIESDLTKDLAVKREREIKGWNREKKENLIKNYQRVMSK